MKNIKGLALRQSAELKLLGSDESDSIVYISGYASVYRKENGSVQIDRDYEAVNTDNLDINSYEQNPVLIYSHQWDRVIGKVTKITKDYKGLYVEAEVHKLTGEEAAYEAVKKGLVKSFSIGFVPKDIDIIQGDVVQISSAELVEISIAPVQSNPTALFTVTGTKSLTMSVQDVAKQNNLTDVELKGMFSGVVKGDTMKVETKSTDPIEPVVEPVKPEPTPEPVKPVEPVVEPVKPEPTPEPVKPVEPVVEPVVVPSLDNLSSSIAEALAKVEEAKEQKKLDEEKAKAEAIEQDKLKNENRVKDALAYIKEKADLIASTEVSQLDFDSIEEFYEAVSLATQAVEAKVTALGELVGQQ
jgi:HK97 family phage prohead protease